MFGGGGGRGATGIHVQGMMQKSVPFVKLGLPAFGKSFCIGDDGSTPPLKHLESDHPVCHQHGKIEFRQ